MKIRERGKSLDAEYAEAKLSFINQTPSRFKWKGVLSVKVKDKRRTPISQTKYRFRTHFSKAKPKQNWENMGWGLVRDSDNEMRMIIPIDILTNQTTTQKSLPHSHSPRTRLFRNSNTHFLDLKTQLENPIHRPIYITLHKTHKQKTSISAVKQRERNQT